MNNIYVTSTEIKVEAKTLTPLPIALQEARSLAKKLDCGVVLSCRGMVHKIVRNTNIENLASKWFG